jgi:alpha-beta hydrolase superfamily lysophospholipase
MSTNSRPYVYDNLAFSSGNTSCSTEPKLISAKFRSPFVFHAKGLWTGWDNPKLNVEWFVNSPNDDRTDDSTWPILCYVHGICESAETWTVQHLAMACQEHHWKLCVLELEGHGLSTGKRSLCSNFDRLVQQVEAFVYHVSISQQQSDKTSLFHGFLGAVMICPAVGIASNAIPPPYLVLGLRMLSCVVPSLGILTPYEDPSQYACPPSSTRNFEGHWPLATSKMLLDLTSQKIKDDQQKTSHGSAKLTLEDVPSIMILVGGKDHVIPVESVREFMNNLHLQDKTMSVIPEGDHGLMAHHETSRKGVKIIFDWLNLRLQKQI